MKKIIQAFASFLFIRMITRFILKIKGLLERIISNLKYRALVKDCTDSICHYTTEIKYGDRIKVGKGSRIGKNCTLGAKGGISIGENVVLSKYVTVETAGLDLSQGPPYHTHFAKPVVIEDGVWIGTNCIILNGVTIGGNSIIGASTVITKDVPANSVIVGAQNRKLK